MKILLVEDDRELAELTMEYLSGFGYQMIHEGHGLNAVERVLQETPDLLLLDIMLPGKSGIDICKELRPHYNNPIIMLTARTDKIDQIVGLEIGADDYICKPVDPRLLSAKISAVERRIQREKSAIETPNTFIINEIEFNHGARKVRCQNRELTLTTQEYDLLYLLACNAGKILPREYIYSQIRGFEYDGLSRFVDITVSRLRHKIKHNTLGNECIKTVRNRGYLFIPQENHETTR